MDSVIVAWIRRGEAIYAAAVEDYRLLEAQLNELQEQMLAKQEEVEKIARLICRPDPQDELAAPDNRQIVVASLVEDVGQNPILARPPHDVLNWVFGKKR